MKNVINLKNIIVTIVGTLLIAVSVSWFYSNLGIAVGGSTGLSLLIYRLSGLPASITILIFNVLMIISSWIILGKSYVVNTVLGSLCYPFLLMIVEKIRVPEVSGLIPVALGAFIFGVGCSIVMSANASTGGSDSIGMILKKKTGIPVEKSMLAVDGLILILSLCYLNRYTILLSVFALIIQMGTIRTFTKLFR